MPLRKIGTLAALLCFTTLADAQAADLVSRAALKPLDLQLYWQARVGLDAGDTIDRIVALDDNIYLLSADNRAYCVHAATGLIRWSVEVAPPGQTVRGPTHSPRAAVFTTSTGIRLFDRRTGRLIGEPRSLVATLVEVRGDRADINIGRLHGLTPGDTLDVFRGTESGQAAAPIARFKAELVRDRECVGRFTELDQGNRPRPGDRLAARVEIPIEQIRAPFAPSSPAVADKEYVYYGAANQRFYSLLIIGGYRSWELLTPKTVTAEPVLIGEQLYLAGQNGHLTKLNARDRSPMWPEPFKAEGPIFARPAVSGELVCVASLDRSVYAIRANSGRRVWRQRFEAELLNAPQISGEAVYQFVPGQGVVALDAADGEPRWRISDGLRLVTRIDKSIYLLVADAPLRGELLEQPALVRVDEKSGKLIGAALPLSGMSLVAGTSDPPSVYAADRLGNLVCLRWSEAPFLRATEVADALRDEVTDGMAERRAAAAVKPGKPAGKPVDPFASRTTAPPAASSGVTPSEPAETQPAEKKADEPAEGENGEKPNGEDKPADEGDSAGEKDESADKEGDSESGDESGKGESGEGESGEGGEKPESLS